MEIQAECRCRGSTRTHGDDRDVVRITEAAHLWVQGRPGPREVVREACDPLGSEGQNVPRRCAAVQRGVCGGVCDRHRHSEPLQVCKTGGESRMPYAN